MGKTLGYVAGGVAIALLIVVMVAKNVSEKRAREQRDRELMESRLRELAEQEDRLLATVGPRSLGHFQKQVRTALAEYKRRTAVGGDPTGTNLIRLKRSVERAKEEALNLAAERTRRPEDFMDRWEQQLDREGERLLKEAGVTLEDR